MLRPTFTAIAICFTLMSNVGLLGMNIQQLPQETLRHIFVWTSSFTQNQLKNSCKIWHTIGTKKAPNMYALVVYQSFNPSQDDWSYIMMNAALDENIEVMKNILNHTGQRKFNYDFGGNRSFRLYDMPVIKKLQEYSIWTKEAPEEFKALDLASSLDKQVVVPTDLFTACFTGNPEKIKQALDTLFIIHNYVGLSDQIAMYENIYNALFIAVYNNNPYCIELLAPHCNKRKLAQEVHLNLLFMAMKKQKKHAFKALVQNNVYGCLNDVRLNRAWGSINTTTLDEICKQTDVHNLNAYIAMYRELGGKTLVELRYNPNTNYGDTPESCIIF